MRLLNAPMGIAVVGLWLGCAHVSIAQQLSFRWQDTTGGTVAVEPSVTTGAPVTVLCFLGTECPMARAYAVKLGSLQAEFGAERLRIVGIMSNLQDSAAEINAFAEELQLAYPVVRDADQAIADRFGATRTPECFLLDQELELQYRGRIDDQYAPGVVKPTAAREELKSAIAAVLAGKPVAVPQTPAVGCLIGRAPDATPSTSPPPQSITYAEHVSRVLQRHCIDCHRAGEIGPFAMESYDEVIGWAETMLETVEQQRMPPWHADPQVGDFVNQRSMPERDKQILRDWIAGGLQRGDPADEPPALETVAGWQLPREPDLVVEMRSRPFQVPREGVVEYQYFVADPGFVEDRWVTAAQVVPGSPAVVHHAIVFVRPPDGAGFRGIGWLSAYVPGQRLYALPPGRARKVPAGSKFVFQMHYTPNGTEQNDTTKVGLLFGQDEDITHEVLTLMAVNQEFEIPPGDARHQVLATVKNLPPAGELLSITPHMHYRGKAFRLWGRPKSSDNPKSPDNLLLNVPNYDFNWQHTYQLRTPLPLNGFNGLLFEATFDNSAENPFNPDPSQLVTWGDQTWEEMAVGFFDVAQPRQPQQPSSRSAVASPTQTDVDREVEAYVARVMQELDSNQDGVIRKSEAAIVVRKLSFANWDLNDDGLATEAEVRDVANRLFR